MRSYWKWGIPAFLSVVAGCAPPGQRLFNPDAGKPPKVRLVGKHQNREIQEPFVLIVIGTPQAEWRPAVDRVARLALARKPSVLFTVTVLSPRDETPRAQVETLKALSETQGQQVLEALVEAGAAPEQVLLRAVTDPAYAKPTLRIDVR